MNPPPKRSKPRQGEIPLPDAAQLCTDCGLCCDGTIFADVKLQPSDHSPKLRLLGVQSPSNHRLPQPCPAFDGRLCSIYHHRPNYCRHFECHLLQRLQAGNIDRVAAVKLINRAKRLTRKIKHLLAALGNHDHHLSLAKRFRNTTRRIGQGIPAPDSATLYGDLTLAVHSLNVLLSEHFYTPNT